MRKNILSILTAATLAVFVGPAVQAQADTLADTMADAYRNSDLLDQNRYLLRLQDEGVAQQVAGLRPVINFVATSRWTTPSTGQMDRGW